MFIILESLVWLSSLKKVVRKFASPWHLFMLYRNGGKKRTTIVQCFSRHPCEIDSYRASMRFLTNVSRLTRNS